MSIGEIVNSYGNKHTPYQENLVNHLPMGQFAYYKLTNDIDGVKKFTEQYIKRASITLVKKDYEELNDIWECVEQREGYEACLEILKEEMDLENWQEYISMVLDKLKLGMSTGLFHALIRVAYAVEGIKEDKEYIHELRRAMAYYITAYKGAGVFDIAIERERLIHEFGNLSNNPNIKKLLKQETMGKKLKALYGDPMYMKVGFTLDGTPDEKASRLLDLLIPLYIETDNIVVLHCITGLHALVVLKDCFEDYSYVIDIITTSIISHLLTVEGLYVSDKELEVEEESWDEIFQLAAKSTDVHTIKLAYTGSELDKMFNKTGLKTIVKRRIAETV